MIAAFIVGWIVGLGWPLIAGGIGILVYRLMTV